MRSICSRALVYSLLSWWFASWWLAPLPAQQPASPAKPQVKKPVTLEAMLANTLPRVSLVQGGRRGPASTGIAWLADGEHYTAVSGNGKRVKVNARTGEEAPLSTDDGIIQSLQAANGIQPNQAQNIAQGTRAGLDDLGRVLFQISPRDYILADPEGKPARRFAKLPVGAAIVSLSPTGNFLAFTWKGNLGTAPLDGEQTTLHTNDGSETILNGRADWVYEEEIFNRNPKAYWWGPNDQLAFLRFDDEAVPKFPITGMLKRGADVETLNYPKSGDPNPLVKIGILDAQAGTVKFLNLGTIDETDFVVCRVGWWPGKAGVPYAYLMNRIQSYLDVATWPDLDGAPKILFRDTTKAWVEDLGEPVPLADGRFLIFSERDGWKHLYHYTAEGKLLNQVTRGEWEALTVERVDETEGWVYVSGTYEASNGRQFVRAKLDGSSLERLTPEPGTHSVTMAPKGSLFVDRHSDWNTLPTVTVRDAATGTIIRSISETKLPANYSDYSWGRVERVKIPTENGYELEAMLTFPPDFDSKKQYPLWVMTYAGPHTPTVRDAYSPKLMEQVLANTGIVVMNVDPYAASGKGAQSAWTAYKQLGVGELKDLERAVRWAKEQGWLDDARVGLQGHSFGGYITAYAITHSKVFSAGISGAPVTDWALYDSIYTERFMQTPKQNPDGYKKSSVVAAADKLHGQLLLIHGMIDDNVHLQNTAQLIQALQQADRNFEVMFYPSARHGIGGIHYQKLMYNFIQKTMQPKLPHSATSTSQR